jgi:phosphohistidine phosphatase SixA
VRSVIVLFLWLRFFFTGLSPSNSSIKKTESPIYCNENIYLLRHALAPGTGDPDNFDVNDCETQRNLSNAGRSQAIRIGKKLRDNLKILPQVFSSQWCRCKETAKILALGHVTELPSLNSFFESFHLKDEQTTQLKDWLLQLNNKTPVVLVTHQVNITALTEIYPSSGEIVVIRITGLGEVKIVGTIATD